jgi:RecJ-like exonuclease
MVIVGLAYSQDNKSSKTDADVLKVEVNTFKDKAPELVGKTVQIEGMVTHVCKHGGKKLFIMTDNADVQVKITTGEKIAAFPTELEGSTIWAKGVVEEIEEEMSEEEAAEKQDEAHKNIYHVKQYSIAAIEYQVVKK